MGKKIMFFEPTKTQQHEAMNMDINAIMSRYNKTKMAPISKCNPLYGDFTNVNSYHEALNKVINIQNEFMALPGHIKRRFSQNPEKLMQFLDDPENIHEAIELGLVERPENYRPPEKKKEPIDPEKINEKVATEILSIIRKRKKENDQENGGVDNS